MKSTYETGHAKNVANLSKLITQIELYDKYDPPVEALTVENLTTLRDEARQRIEEVEARRAENKNAIHRRQDLYRELNPLCTRVVNHLDILGLSSGAQDRARALNKRIQGSATAKKVVMEDGEDGMEETTVGISTSRQSFTQRAEHFSQLLTLIRTVDNYEPNEDDLKMENLDNLLAEMNNATTAVDQTEAALNKALRLRNEVLYARNTGVYDRAMHVKKYVRSVYGSTSDQHSRVSGILFTMISK
ncbi:hypothetical protein [Sinomicrobium oceani]|uniref:hypothetical protein n=1 Tax=Sinomicrobium oceani TaxID=1150368 RepID=UPI00227B2A3E|nr:hypothetical protein [Sinomicrobium oceani]